MGPRLRATAKSKSFIFLSTLKDGRKVLTTIGDPSHYIIDEARAKATELQKLINDGQDP